jgi:hypothetical protein
MDIRERWALFANYEIPFGRGLRGFAGAVGNGWQANAMATLMAGATRQLSSTIGNVGRNTMYGPPLRNLDFSLFKNFKPTGRMTLQLCGEMFNILNHPNFGIPGNQVGAAAFDVISERQQPAEHSNRV